MTVCDVPLPVSVGQYYVGGVTDQTLRSDALDSSRCTVSTAAEYLMTVEEFMSSHTASASGDAGDQFAASTVQRASIFFLHLSICTNAIS